MLHLFESDLNAVIQFYSEVYEELKDKYDIAKLIFWYEEQAVEKFRETDNTILTINQIKSIIKKIE